MNVPGTAGLALLLVYSGVGLLRPERRLLSRLLFVGALVGCAVIGHRQWRMARGYELIEASHPLDDVVELMGAPDRETDGTISLTGDPKDVAELVPGCTRELWYEVFWRPEHYALCFDRSGRLLQKQHEPED